MPVQPLIMFVASRTDLGAALVEKHHDRLDALWRSALAAELMVVASSRKLTDWMPAGADDVRRALERQADEADLDAADILTV